MRALLDVNVLIALLDADHISHQTALGWFASNAAGGWASCAITQNGCLRIMSHPGYPNAHPVRAIAERLRDLTAQRVHAFWPDDVSLLDERAVDATRIHGPRQLTHVYLLALAVAHSGRLITFDHAMVLDAVIGATTSHLVRL
jgi:uncharacterized protein